MANTDPLPLGLHVAGLSFGPLETLLLVAALALAVLTAIELVRRQRAELLRQRIAQLRGAVISNEETAPVATPWYDRLGAAVARSPLIGAKERQRLAMKLANAGIGGPGRVATFIAIKTCLTLLSASIVWGALQSSELFGGRQLAPSVILGSLMAAIILAWRIPDIVLARLTSKRKYRLEVGLPDALDLLVICAEAGLGLDQAIAQVARDLRLSAPEVASEFAMTAAEMRVAEDRRTALENLAARTGLDTLRSLISTLNQSTRFGTPLSESLRVMASEMRTIRISRFEERAARLAVTLMIPLMIFVLPCLFLVIGGPMVIRAIDTFHH